jgi:F-type H+-transporting ATPase subunit b
MRRAARAALPAAAALLLASVAQAAEGEHHASLEDLLYALFDFALLIGVLVYFARKPLVTFFRDRRLNIQDELKTAADLRTEAEARYAKWQRRLMDLDAELAGIRAQARERAEAERERILAEANATAERIRRDAHAAVDQELRRARARLRQEAADLAVELAAESLHRQVTDADHDRLLDEFVQTVERPPATRAAAPRGR